MRTTLIPEIVPGGMVRDGFYDPRWKEAEDAITTTQDDVTNLQLLLSAQTAITFDDNFTYLSNMGGSNGASYANAGCRICQLLSDRQLVVISRYVESGANQAWYGFKARPPTYDQWEDFSGVVGQATAIHTGSGPVTAAAPCFSEHPNGSLFVLMPDTVGAGTLCYFWEYTKDTSGNFTAVNYTGLTNELAAQMTVGDVLFQPLNTNGIFVGANVTIGTELKTIISQFNAVLWRVNSAVANTWIAGTAIAIPPNSPSVSESAVARNFAISDDGTVCFSYSKNTAGGQTFGDIWKSNQVQNVLTQAWLNVAGYRYYVTTGAGNQEGYGRDAARTVKMDSGKMLALMELRYSGDAAATYANIAWALSFDGGVSWQASNIIGDGTGATGLIFATEASGAFTNSQLQGSGFGGQSKAGWEAAHIPGTTIAGLVYRGIGLTGVYYSQFDSSAQVWTSQADHIQLTSNVINGHPTLEFDSAGNAYCFFASTIGNNSGAPTNNQFYTCDSLMFCYCPAGRCTEQAAWTTPVAIYQMYIPSGSLASTSADDLLVGVPNSEYASGDIVTKNGVECIPVAFTRYVDTTTPTKNELCVKWFPVPLLQSVAQGLG